MGLLQNGFKDAMGVFKFHGAGLSNGAIPQELVGNWHLTGRGRNLTAGQGIPSEQVGVPLGYGQGVAWMMPQKRGQMSARMYDISITASANGVMGFPITGSATISALEVTGTLLPEDDSSPSRTASATFEVTATGSGELKSSGSGSAVFSITVADAELLGTLSGEGSAQISVTTNSPTLGAEASLTGEASIILVSSGWLLPLNDHDPARTTSAMISMSGSLTPYAVGNMIGSALPYTELSPQSLAQAVWQAPAADNNQPGSMGSKVNTASSGGVDMDALAEAVWGYTP